MTSKPTIEQVREELVETHLHWKHDKSRRKAEARVAARTDDQVRLAVGRFRYMEHRSDSADPVEVA